MTTKVVPREPDKAMQNAGVDTMFDREGSDLRWKELSLIVRKGWRAMFDAAPAAEEERQEPVAWMYQYDAAVDGPVVTTKRWAATGTLWTETPLYASPVEPSAPPEPK